VKLRQHTNARVRIPRARASTIAPTHVAGIHRVPNIACGVFARVRGGDDDDDGDGSGKDAKVE
jgi:hypothetical protein